ncbi:WD40 repeat-like protein [Trametes cingulata]|nr:WD40 repeat-like protein [Trametes cingulata]
MWPKMFPSTRGRYRVIATLTGHTTGVFSLDFSDDGRHLASGGGDGLKVWDLKTKLPLRVPEHRNAFGPVSQVLWIPTRSKIPTVCSGTGFGYLCLCTQSADTGSFTGVFARRLGGGAEILGLAHETLTPTDIRIAVTDRSCFVGVYSYDGRGKLLPICTTRLNHCIPISISFAETRAREVHVFGLHDGTILTDKIGYASIQAKQQLLLVDNVSTGFDAWNLSSETHQRTFPTGKPIRFLPRQVHFADEAKTIVGGSDHGAVYVFDRKTGAPVDVLRHAQQGLVQTIAILLWEAKKSTKAATTRRTPLTLGNVLWTFVQLAMLSAVIAFILQNVGGLSDVVRRAQSAAGGALRTGSSPPMVHVATGHSNRQVIAATEGGTATRSKSTAENSRSTTLWKEWKSYVGGGEMPKGRARVSWNARDTPSEDQSRDEATLRRRAAAGSSV